MPFTEIDSYVQDYPAALNKVLISFPLENSLEHLPSRIASRPQAQNENESNSVELFQSHTRNRTRESNVFCSFLRTRGCLFLTLSLTQLTSSRGREVADCSEQSAHACTCDVNSVQGCVVMRLRGFLRIIRKNCIICKTSVKT